MNLDIVANLIEMSLDLPPHPLLLDLCQVHYQPYYHLLYRLAGEYSTSQAVELGVHNGRGVGAMAMSGIERVVGIDHFRHPDLDDIQKQFSNFVFLECDSLPVPGAITGTIDILHIDTEHSFSQAKAEFEAYEPFLEKGAVVLFDDLHAQDDGVLNFFASLPGPKIQDDRLHPTCGYGVLIYE